MLGCLDENSLCHSIDLYGIALARSALDSWTPKTLQVSLDPCYAGIDTSRSMTYRRVVVKSQGDQVLDLFCSKYRLCIGRLELKTCKIAFVESDFVFQDFDFAEASR